MAEREHEGLNVTAGVGGGGLQGQSGAVNTMVAALLADGMNGVINAPTGLSKRCNLAFNHL